MNGQRDSHPVPPEQIRRGHEPETTRAGLVALAGGGLVVLILITLALMYGLTRFFAARAGEQGELRPAAEVTEPLSTRPNQEYQRILMQRENYERLDSYGWVDREAGIVHIPIQRAMERLASEGLPMAEPTVAAGNGPHAAGNEERGDANERQ